MEQTAADDYWYNQRVIKNRLHILMAEKAAREGRKPYSNREVASLTGLSKDLIGAYVNNGVTRYDESTLNALCRWLRCQPGDLLRYEEKEEVATEGGPE